MNRDDIIRMAREAGFDYSGAELTWESVICTDELERFAALVMSAECDRLTNFAIQAAEKAVDVAIALEREACAKVCDEYEEWCGPWGQDDNLYAATESANEIAKAIRARGQE